MCSGDHRSCRLSSPATTGLWSSSPTTSSACSRVLLLRRPPKQAWSSTPRRAVDYSQSPTTSIVRTVVESLPPFRVEALTAVPVRVFEPAEVLRLLPKCKHGFHVECVDVWLSALPGRAAALLESEQPTAVRSLITSPGRSSNSREVKNMTWNDNPSVDISEEQHMEANV